MPRVKRGVIANKRRKNLLKLTKGFDWRRKSNYRAAKEAVLKAGKYAHRDRRAKKRSFRSLWIVRLNAACRNAGITYSRFVEGLKAANIELDRKVLSDIAIRDEAAFNALVKQAQDALKAKATAAKAKA